MKIVFLLSFVLLFYSLSALVVYIPRLPLSIDVSDIDLDGTIDVAIGHCTSGGDVHNYPTITILRNFNNGGFESIDTSYTQPAYLETIRFAKMNDDEYPDMVIWYDEFHDPESYNYMRIFYNDMGNYDNPTDYLMTTIWNTAYFDFTCADVNGDGLDDPAFASNSNLMWTSAINLGDNQFSEAISMDLGFPPQAITAGDVTGDGISDILISGWPLTMFSYINVTWQSTIIDTGYLASESKICDIDNDGDNDIITYLIPPMGYDCTMKIYENQNGQLSLRFQHIYSFVSGLAVFDHNNDNLPDFLLGNKLVTNQGNFTFSEPVQLHQSAAGDRNAFADMDNNGYLDILSIASDYVSNIGLFKVSYNDCNGNFLPNPPTENIDDANDSPQITMSSYPNPFKTTVTISFDVPKDYSEGMITIFNIRGENVTTIPIYSKMSKVIWDGTDINGRVVSSGLYFARIEHGNTCRVSKMMLMR